MDAEFWNERYADDARSYGEAPNAFLAACAGLLPTPGDGQGRNGVWLAERGLDVTSIDLSDVAVGQARALAARRGVEIDARVGDLLADPPEARAFDVVAVIYLHVPPELRPRLHGVLADALAPGGVMVVEGFAPGQTALREGGSGGPPREDMMIDLATLAADMPALDRLYGEEATLALAEGQFHRGLAKVCRAVLRRP